jgi:phage repressor protein C with HTH and peptisase S24 domain
MGRPRVIKNNEITPFIQRLNEVLLGTNIKELAEKAGLSPAALSNILNGAQPRIDNLMAIAEASGKSVEWLLNGTEPLMSDVEELVHLEDSHVIASAGKGYDNSFEEDMEKYIIPRIILRRLDVNPDYAKIIYARGNSMSPTINDGDMTIVDIDKKQMIDGQVFVFVAENSLYIKRLRNILGQGWTAYSDNTEYQPMTLPKGDDLHIIGRVIWSERKL